eukprot:COSAG06_NODE_8831_length_2059_cov_172.021939_2_plen_287_part_00
MSNSSNSSGGGNTKTPPPKQESPKKRWCLTLNNYSDNEYFNLIDSLSSDSSNKFIIGKEVGESGTPHLQIYINFYKKTRFSAIKKINNRFHIESAKGSEIENIKYCSKDGKYECRNLKVPRALILLDESKLYNFQKIILDIIKNEIPDDRSIYWFKDDNGNTGKTSFCKLLCARYGAIMLGGKSADMKNGIVEYKSTNHDTPELILINLPRSFNNDYLSYTGIEEVKDMCFYSGKYEGGMVVGNSPHIIIFSNELPDLNKLSKDRWNIFDIDENLWFYKDGVEITC